MRRRLGEAERLVFGEGFGFPNAATRNGCARLLSSGMDCAHEALS